MASPTAFLKGLLTQFIDDVENALKDKILPAHTDAASHSVCYLLGDEVNFPDLKSASKIRYVLALPRDITDHAVKFNTLTTGEAIVSRGYDQQQEEQKGTIGLLHDKKVESPFLVFPLYDNGQGLKVMQYYSYGDLHACLMRGHSHRENERDHSGRLVREDTPEQLVQTARIVAHLRQVANFKKFIGQLILALEALHEKNLVHLDNKPKNILLDFDEHGKLVVRLCDFGEVQEMDEHFHVRDPKKTIAYASQVDGRKLDGYELASVINFVLRIIDRENQIAELNEVRDFSEAFSPREPVPVPGKNQTKEQTIKTKLIVDLKTDPFFGHSDQERDQFFSTLREDARTWLVTHIDKPIVSMPALGDPRYILPDPVACVYSHTEMVIALLDQYSTTVSADIDTLLQLLTSGDVLTLDRAHPFSVAYAAVMSDERLRQHYPIKAIADQLHFQIQHIAKEWLSQNLLAVKVVELEEKSFALALRLVPKRTFLFSDKTLVDNENLRIPHEKGVLAIITHLVARFGEKESWSKNSMKSQLCRKLFAHLKIECPEGKEEVVWNEHKVRFGFIVGNFDNLQKIVVAAKLGEERFAQEQLAAYRRVRVR